ADVQPLLSPPLRHALDVPLLRAYPGARPPGRLEIAAAALAAISILSGRESLVLAVDDLQWLDAQSARVLAYVVRRLEGARAAVLATIRVPAAEDAPAALDAAWLDERVVRIRVPPLSVAALHQRLPDRLALLPGGAV